jgi:exonuclease VII small subunit
MTSSSTTKTNEDIENFESILERLNESLKLNKVLDYYEIDNIPLK